LNPRPLLYNERINNPFFDYGILWSKVEVIGPPVRPVPVAILVTVPPPVGVTAITLLLASRARDLETVPEGCNVIVGQSHFIKTIKTIYEAISRLPQPYEGVESIGQVANFVNSGP
jgi:hypothetical protein